jgi:hypothetical protein
MKRITLALLVVVAALLAVPAALAGHPHFVTLGAFVDSQGRLVCKFRLAGLGSTTGQDTTVTCSATSTVSYGGGGGPCPPSYSSGSNTYSVYGGNINGSVSLSAAGIGCGVGIYTVSYYDVAITDSTIGSKSAYPIPGTFTRTFAAAA